MGFDARRLGSDAADIRAAVVAVEQCDPNGPSGSMAEIESRLLASIPTSEIRPRISVSRWYAGRIRGGYRPHPRHWLALAQLVGVSQD
jgi:hypothetical protein